MRAVCAAWSCSHGSNSFGSFSSRSGRAPRRACSALVRWPYPWRSPSGTRIPATGRPSRGRGHAVIASAWRRWQAREAQPSRLTCRRGVSLVPRNKAVIRACLRSGSIYPVDEFSNPLPGDPAWVPDLHAAEMPCAKQPVNLCA